jgi:transglutaminase-like putative cysteine protease
MSRMGNPGAGAAKTHAPAFNPTIDRVFEVSLFLLIVTGFTTLASTGRLDIFSILVGWIAMAVRGFLLLRNRRVLIPERWTSFLTIFYVLFYALDYLLVSASFVTATVHLLLFIMIVKMFSVQRERDHVYLAVLSFLEVLSAAVLTVDTAFFGAFCLFIVVAVATFVTMEMRRSAAKAGPVAGPDLEPAPHRFARTVSVSAVCLTLAIVAGGAAIFFVLPRLSAGYLSDYAPRNDFVSGFSDQVQLGAIGRIQQSQAIVMHIHIDNDRGGYASLKWRGMSLANFDGRTWKNATNEVLVDAAGNGRFDLLDAEQKAGNIAENLQEVLRGSKRLRYSVAMEPIGTHVLFLASVPVMVFGQMRQVAIDDSGAVWNLDNSRMLEGYTAISLLPDPAEQRQSAANSSSSTVTAQYLELPHLDPRIPVLARQITAGQTTSYGKATATELYLRTHFGYTLQLPSSMPEDPLANFLFQRKKGHCEYFASAMAVMLRTLDIPSRVVNGFRMGEYNDVTGSYIVRGRDAHSWVEAYFPGAGWVAFDPTPADAAPDTGSLHRLGLYLDAAREFWREWVINYDFVHQQNVTLSAMLKSRTVSDRFRLWVRRKYVGLLLEAKHAYARGSNLSPRDIALSVLLATLLLAGSRSRPLLRHWRMSRLARNPQRAPDLAASIWYGRLLRALSRRGWHKRPTQTPGEFAASIEDPALRTAVKRFTGRYESARFGRSSEDARQLPELYEEIIGK